MVEDMMQSITTQDQINILLVDDKESNLISLEALLYDNNLNFLNARSGEEALRIALNEDLALILLDVQMPNMDGFEVASYLKSIPKTKYTPIIFVTAISNTHADMIQGYSEGGIDYLFKPLNPELTRAKVHSFIQIYLQQRELKQKNITLESFGQFVNNSADIMLSIAGKHFIVEQANPACLEHFEKNGAPFVGTSVLEYLNKAERLSFKQALLTNENEKSFRLENFIQTNFGKKWINWTISHKNKKWYLNGKDITQTKEAALLLKKNSQKLKESNKQLEQFAYIASHDFQGPIANLRKLMEMIDVESIEQTRTQKILEKMQISIDSLDHTLKGLMEVISVRRLSTKNTNPINIQQVFEEVCASIQEHIDHANAAITLDLKEVEQINYPQVHLKSILLNLISNSIKYRDVKRALKINIRTFLSNGIPCLSISDNGLGIDLQKYKKEIFGLFKRFHTHIQGNGVGLYNVKSIIESHGGSIHVTSEVGKGTTFHIQFHS